MAIECLVLGAGQEVGKSCVVATVGSKRIMFDCGMHMGCAEKPYPDFSRISPTGDFDSVLSCIIITHFHLDHVGALPYFTEVCGYRGPIYMTYPTKALAPLMLEDYRKVMVERRGEEEQFSNDHIMECMKKVIAVDIKQTVQVDKDIQIRAYYAGHVLGAAMFYAKVGESTFVYTGDYNMTPDRHLGAAQIDRLQLDLVITESTYATTTRDSKYAKEREFLKIVHKCVDAGGKVLIPTFAMGRAQELCILLDDYWQRMNLKVPIYFSAGLTIQANMYYKMLIGWTSQKIKNSHARHNPFEFKNVYPFNRSIIHAPGPCVLFATPGMITGGFSLEVFKHWATSEKNLITLPGYCLAGTIGHKLMSGKPTKIDLDKNTQIDVRCQIHQLSFSPHTDAKGIMDLVRFLLPRHVILVHGEKPSMEKLKGRIQSELGIQCYNPANNETVVIPTTSVLKIGASKMFLRKCSSAGLFNGGFKVIEKSNLQELTEKKVGEGILVMDKTRRAKVIHESELSNALGIEENRVKFCYCCPVALKDLTAEDTEDSSMNGAQEYAENTSSSLSRGTLLQLLNMKLKKTVECKGIEESSDHLYIGSLSIRLCQDQNCPYRSRNDYNASGSSAFFCCSWSISDEKLAQTVLSIMRNLNSGLVHDGRNLSAEVDCSRTVCSFSSHEE